MKEQKTLIMISVRIPTILNHQKTEAIQKKIFDEIVVPFKCEKKMHCTQSKLNNQMSTRVMIYYIFKPGKLKKSVQDRLDRVLAEMQRNWLSMVESRVLTIDA